MVSHRLSIACSVGCRDCHNSILAVLSQNQAIVAYFSFSHSLWETEFNTSPAKYHEVLFTTSIYATFLSVDFFAVIPNPLVKNKTSNPPGGPWGKEIPKCCTEGFWSSERYYGGLNVLEVQMGVAEQRKLPAQHLKLKRPGNYALNKRTFEEGLRVRNLGGQKRWFFKNKCCPR